MLYAASCALVGLAGDVVSAAESGGGLSVFVLSEIGAPDIPVCPCDCLEMAGVYVGRVFHFHA